MFDKDAIEALQYGGGIQEASSAMVEAFTSARLVGLPDHFTVHDLEKFMPHRRRARGTMETSSISDFAAYVNQNQELGAAVFVSPSMVANAVLNMGTPNAPGHADNRAQFKPRATAAYLALLAVANGRPLTQQAVAEFMEDWAHLIRCLDKEEPMHVMRAIAAVRNITIEGLRKVEATEQQLSATRSAFESVTASSKDTLPTFIHFKCQPYLDFSERNFVMRLGIVTTDKPAITLRIVAKEQHDEELAQELCNRVRDAVSESGSVPTLVGDYTAK